MRADWIIDLGPDGGEDGGRVVATGTPEQVMRSRKSYTGEALRKLLQNGRAAAKLKYHMSMNIDERLERLTARHEALAQTVELMAAMQEGERRALRRKHRGVGCADGTGAGNDHSAGPSACGE